MFTKQHFEQTAKLIRESDLSLHDRVTVMWEFAWVFRDSNPRFDNARFIKVCKPRDNS